MPGEGLHQESAIDQEVDPEVLAEEIGKGGLEVEIGITDQEAEIEGKDLVAEIGMPSLQGQGSHSPEHFLPVAEKGEGAGSHRYERRRSKKKKEKKQQKEKNKISKLVVPAPNQIRKRKI